VRTSLASVTLAQRSPHILGAHDVVPRFRSPVRRLAHDIRDQTESRRQLVLIGSDA
jgi:hypothetical protein